MTAPSSSGQAADGSDAWQSIMLPECPAPKGAYSPGVRAGDLFFVSGQVPRDPKTGDLIGGDDVAAQTKATLANVAAVLQTGGATLADVVSMTVYLTNADDWSAFDAAYREVMKAPFPTRAAVGVSLRGILVEISAIAYLGGRS